MLDAGERLLLASASQDKYIRVWAIQGQALGAEDVTPSETPSAASLSRHCPFRIRFNRIVMSSSHVPFAGWDNANAV